MADLTVGRGNGRISRASFSNLLGPLCFKVDLGSTRKFHERKLAQSLPREFLHGFMIASKPPFFGMGALFGQFANQAAPRKGCKSGQGLKEIPFHRT